MPRRRCSALRTTKRPVTPTTMSDGKKMATKPRDSATEPRNDAAHTIVRSAAATVATLLYSSVELPSRERS